jgi:O-methyltransferase
MRAKDTRVSAVAVAPEVRPIRRAGRWLKRILRELRWWSSPPPSLQELRVLRTVAPYTMVPTPRLRTLWKLSHRVSAEHLEGAFVECGSYNGGTGAILAHAAARSGRMVWLFDSFEGMPEPGAEDGERAKAWVGECLGQEAMVREVLTRVDVQPDRVRIVKGWFQDTLGPSPTGPIALLHLDADWYDSTKTILEQFYDRVRPGGYLVLDDYGQWPGCRRALDEFLASQEERPRLIPSDNEGIWFRKPLSSSNDLGPGG